MASLREIRQPSGWFLIHMQPAYWRKLLVCRLVPQILHSLYKYRGRGIGSISPTWLFISTQVCEPKCQVAISRYNLQTTSLLRASANRLLSCTTIVVTIAIRARWYLMSSLAYAVFP